MLKPWFGTLLCFGGVVQDNNCSGCGSEGQIQGLPRNCENRQLIRIWAWSRPAILRGAWLWKCTLTNRSAEASCRELGESEVVNWVDVVNAWGERTLTGQS
jgi:hypothetical protein